MLEEVKNASDALDFFSFFPSVSNKPTEILPRPANLENLSALSPNHAYVPFPSHLTYALPSDCIKGSFPCSLQSDVSLSQTSASAHITP